MKVLLLGPYWANAGHGAESGIYDALVELGHETRVYDYRKEVWMDEHGNSCKVDPEHLMPGDVDVTLCPGAGVPDRILQQRWWQSCVGKKVLWNSEPIRLDNYRARVVGQRGQYDVTFTFDESEIPLYKKDGIDAKWLPQAFNPRWYRPLDPNESDDLGQLPGEICFVGSIGGKWSNREIFLQRLSREYSVTIATTFNAQMVNQIYNRSKLVLNLGLYCPQAGPPEKFWAFGLQQRIFEAIGAGRICVTNSIPPGDNEIFADRKEVLFYTCNDLEEVIEYGLDETNRQRMLKRILEIRQDHTYSARLRKMFEMLR